MMSTPIALQLYSVREALANDFTGVIREVSDIGYAGVELIFNLPGTTAAEAAKLFQELDLKVAAAHTPLPLGADRNKVLDFMDLFGCDHIVTTPGPEYFETTDKIYHTCDRFNEANQIAQGRNMTFAVHNHWWEFEKVGGRYVYEIMLERLQPEIEFELDTYWIQTAGVNPISIIKTLAKRAALIHLKDGPAVIGEPQVALGQGVMDVPALAHAADPYAEWFIVELDHCATDMMQAVDQSYHFLVDKGLASVR